MKWWHRWRLRAAKRALRPAVADFRYWVNWVRQIEDIDPVRDLSKAWEFDRWLEIHQKRGAALMRLRRVRARLRIRKGRRRVARLGLPDEARVVARKEGR